VSRLRPAAAALSEHGNSGRLRLATVASAGLLLLCPLGVSACGGTNVSVATPKSTPEVTAPREAAGEESATTKTKTHSSSDEATSEAAETGDEEATTEETPETGGVEPTEETATGGEVAPTEEEVPAEEEAEGATGGASAP
jgi:hypothetical protein